MLITTGWLKITWKDLIISLHSGHLQLAQVAADIDDWKAPSVHGLYHHQRFTAMLHSMLSHITGLPAATTATAMSFAEYRALG